MLHHGFANPFSTTVIRTLAIYFTTVVRATPCLASGGGGAPDIPIYECPCTTPLTRRKFEAAAVDILFYMQTQRDRLLFFLVNPCVGDIFMYFEPLTNLSHE